MKLAVGPILYYWERPEVFAFYDRLAQAAVDIVYLGETVCSKRRELKLSDWLAIGEALQASGKEVVLSTFALVEAESELTGVQRVVDNGRFAVEANDMAAVSLARERGIPFVGGPHLNNYNAPALQVLARAGAARWVMPVELGRDTLRALQPALPPGMETEVFGFGHIPLAFSARCFTARAHNVAKDDCGLRCRDFPEGILLSTQEDEPFLVLNGVQVQSAQTASLLGAFADLTALGVDVIRLSPRAAGMGEVIEVFRAVLDGGLEADSAAARLRPHLTHGGCNGYWHGAPGRRWLDDTVV